MNCHGGGFFQVLAAGVAGLPLAALSSAEAGAQEASGAPAFRGQHKPKPLSFDPSKLKGLSEKLIRSHWENNYGGAVRALNAVEQRLDTLGKEKDLPPFIYGPLKREELMRTGPWCCTSITSTTSGRMESRGAVL